MHEADIIEFSSHSKTDMLKYYKGKLPLANKFDLLNKLNMD